MRGIKDTIEIEKKKEILKYLNEKYLKQGYIKKVLGYVKNDYFNESYIREITNLLEYRNEDEMK